MGEAGAGLDRLRAPFLGPVRVDLYEPEGQLQAAGARIAFGSDYPVDGRDEFFAVEVAVLREADSGPAFPQYGGKLNADLIVLDRNLFEIPQDDISETRVVTTMVGGRIVYAR